jgi:hypothetical protein
MSRQKRVHKYRFKEVLYKNVSLEEAQKIDHVCTRKRQYPTKNKARVYARINSAKTAEKITEYKCPYGSHWHIGHGQKRSKKKLNLSNKKITNFISKEAR